MARRSISMGIYLPPKPPLSQVHQLIWAARLFRLDTVMVWDHLRDFFPRALWTSDVFWPARQCPSPHDYYEF